MGFLKVYRSEGDLQSRLFESGWRRRPGYVLGMSFVCNKDSVSLHMGLVIPSAVTKGALLKHGPSPAMSITICLAKQYDRSKWVPALALSLAVKGDQIKSDHCVMWPMWSVQGACRILHGVHSLWTKTRCHIYVDLTHISGDNAALASYPPSISISPSYLREKESAGSPTACCRGTTWGWASGDRTWLSFGGRGRANFTDRPRHISPQFAASIQRKFRGPHNLGLPWHCLILTATDQPP